MRLEQQIPDERESVSRFRNTLSGAFGNVLEWYDFAVYGTLAPILGQLFFPSDDPFTSLLAAFGAFAVGYISRPIGGVLLGHIGDVIGRKPSLILSVFMMGVTTTAIGFLPSFDSIGVTASILLVLLRLVQGLSVGGEYPASIVFLSEHAPDGRRGYYASWPMFGSVIGFLLGSGVTVLLTTAIGDAAMQEWGWRVPFLSGAVIAIAGVLFRRGMTEPPGFENTGPDGQAPFVAAFRDHWRSIARIVALTLVNAVGFYLLWVYATSYLTERMHVSTTKAMDVSTLSLVVMLPATTIAAILSDRIGRKPLLYFVGVGTLLLAWPLWSLMHHDDPVMIFLAQAGFAVLYGAGYAGLSVAIIEILPGNVRCSASAIGYNLAQGLFGGTTPLVATYLVRRTSDDFAPVYYLIAAAAISLLATITLKETAGKPLPP
ncbi:MFS transporter [Hoeflea sp. CAU 1731]